MKNQSVKKIGSALLLIIMLFFGVDSVVDLNFDTVIPESTDVQWDSVQEGEPYNNLQEVVDYLSLYDELPPNYLTKKEAQTLGWDASSGNLWEVAPDMSIGGDYFGNFEGRLPNEVGRTYKEADINYQGGYRGPERLVFSNDDLYFYTDDHYRSFEEIRPGGETK